MQDNATKYWAQVFDVSEDLFAGEGLLVKAHSGGMRGRNAAWVFRHDRLCLISAPEAEVRTIETGLEQAALDSVFSRFLSLRFRNRIARAVGPSSQFCAEVQDFKPFSPRITRLLVRGDEAALHRFLSACEEAEIEDSGIDFKGASLFGSFDGDVLAAVSAPIAWADYASNVGILVRPEHRKAHHGISVASATMGSILRDGKTVFYQTLSSNTGAVRIAQTLGCRLFGQMLCVHFG